MNDILIISLQYLRNKREKQRCRNNLLQLKLMCEDSEDLEEIEEIEEREERAEREERVEREKVILFLRLLFEKEKKEEEREERLNSIKRRLCLTVIVKVTVGQRLRGGDRKKETEGKE
jgi:hypothetical protein